MSSKITITDFLIKLGFDSSEVKKGVKSLKKEFEPLNKKISQEAVKQTKEQKKKNNELKKENQLAAKRLAIQKNIDKLKSKGHTETLKSLRGTLRGKNIDKLEEARVRSAKTLHEVEKSIAATKIKAAKVTAAEKVSRSTAKVSKSSGTSGRQQESLEIRRMGFEDTLTGLNNKLDKAAVTPENAQAIKNLRKEIAALNAKGGVAKTRKEFALLKREYKSVANRAGHVTKAHAKMKQEMKAAEFASKSLKSSMMNLSRSYLSVFAAVGATVSFVKTGQELTSLKATLLGVSGTSEGAAKDFDFVSASSKRLGIDLTEATSAYGKLGAAAKSAGLDNAEARNAFLAATELSTAFNLSTSDFEGVSRAMSQILSKGKLSTEELLQLGERVPIAFSSAAKAMNVSTKELFKLIETGSIQSVDFLPDFADEVRAYVRETGMLTASLKTSRVAMNRFVTNYKLNVAGAFGEGLDSGLGEFFSSLSNIMEELNPVFRAFGDILGSIFEFFSPVMSMIWQLVRIPISLFSGIFNTLSDSLDKPIEKMNWLELALHGVWTALKNIAAVVIYPFAKLEEGLDWLDRWFAETDNKLSIVGGKAGALASGSPANLSGTFGSGGGGNTTTNSNQVSQQTTINIDGAKDPAAVGREVQNALDQQFALSIATGY